MRLTPAPFPQIAPWLRDKPACLRHPHDRLWPAAPDVRLPRDSCTSLAPRRETYPPPARLPIVSGPAARNAPTSRPIPGRLWPRGARRPSRPPDPRASLVRGRETYAKPGQLHQSAESIAAPGGNSVDDTQVIKQVEIGPRCPVIQTGRAGEGGQIRLSSCVVSKSAASLSRCTHRWRRQQKRCRASSWRRTRWWRRWR